MAEQQNGTPPIVARGLSVCEPYAWAIVASPRVGRGWKPIENRTWATEYRGPVAVQASTAKQHINEEVAAFVFGADSRIIPKWNHEAIDAKNPLLHRGAIIGVVDIVGCVAHDPADGPLAFEAAVRAAGLQWWLDKYQGEFDAAAAGPEFNGETWSSDAVYWADGPHCFLLDNARQFSQPIPAKGKLNIYRLTPEEISAVAKALRAPLGCPVEYRAKLNATKQTAARVRKAAAAVGAAK